MTRLPACIHTVHSISPSKACTQGVDELYADRRTWLSTHQRHTSHLCRGAVGKKGGLLTASRSSSSYMTCHITACVIGVTMHEEAPYYICSVASHVTCHYITL